MDLKLRPKEECKFDEISLGEIMLRLDPGEGRIKTSRTFRAWEGGGEYNVARGCAAVLECAPAWSLLLQRMRWVTCWRI